jgi:predicted Zn-dependent protease
MPGGFIANDSGLIPATRNENELAGVMAHETAHVTQRHRSGSSSTKAMPVQSTAAMLGRFF